MKKLFSKLFFCLVLAAGMFMAGCNDEVEPPVGPEEDPYLKITDPEDLTLTFVFDQTAAVTIDVDTNVPDWKAARDEDQPWILLKQGNGNFEVSVTEYTQEEAVKNQYRTRSGSVKVTATGCEPISLSIRQTPPAPLEEDKNIYLNVKELEVPAYGSEAEMMGEVEIVTNAKGLKVDLPPTWMEAGFLEEGKKFIFIAHENTSKEARYHTFTFSSTDGTNEPELVVTQLGTDKEWKITLEPTTLTFGATTNLEQIIKILPPMIGSLRVMIPEEADWVYSVRFFYENADIGTPSDRNEIEVTVNPYYETEKDRETEIIIYTEKEGYDPVPIKLIQEKAPKEEKPDLDLTGKWNFTGKIREYGNFNMVPQSYEVDFEFDEVIGGYLVSDIKTIYGTSSPIVLSVDESGVEPMVYFEHHKLNGINEEGPGVVWNYANAVSLLDLELDQQPYPNHELEDPGGLSDESRWLQGIPSGTRIELILSPDGNTISTPERLNFNNGQDTKEYGLALGWGVSVGVNLMPDVKIFDMAFERVEE